MGTGDRARGFIPRHTNDSGEFLDQAGSFLRLRPVEHSVLLSVAAAHVGEPVAGANANLWLWVEDGGEVVAAAQHTPPQGAYLSTGPTRALEVLTRTLWLMRPGLPGVAGPGTAPLEFAEQWSRLGGPQARPAMRMGVYAADDVTIPLGVPGTLRPAADADAVLLRRWVDQFVAEAGVIRVTEDQIGPRIDAGLLFLWEVEGAPVSMAAVTLAEAGVSRVQYVYTPPEIRRHGYASACVAALTARELASAGRTCMLFTDLTNATSNSIYQAVGYRRLGDAVELRFRPSTPGASS
jgi:GNAT superfamily N-acetyltransferase